MSDIHHTEGPRTFTQIARQFQHEKGEKHVRFSKERELHVHDSIKPSSIMRGAADKRAAKQEEGARQVKEAITREYGPLVANYLFQSGQKTITVSDLNKMKAQLETDPKVAQLRHTHLTQQHIQNQQGIFDFVKKEIQGTKQIETFLRGNSEGNSTVMGNLSGACGGHFTKISGMVTQLIDKSGPAVMTKRELEKLHPKDHEAALTQSVTNLKAALTMLFGGTHDGDITKAAAKVPQEYCDQLAAALLAIKNDEKLGNSEKQQMRQIVFANFGALRLVNPTLLSGSQSSSPSGKTAVMELTKQIQNICSGVKFGQKEEIGRKDEFNALVDQWAPVYQKFMEELAGRGRPTVT